jgi:Carboxypeptidase regulatory-like domain/TonB dependent receptor
MFKQILFTIFTVILLSSFVFAQNTKGTISGTISDQNGAVVPNAKVTVSDSMRGFSSNLQSNDSGSFKFTTLEPSVYQMKIEASGFNLTTLKNISVKVGETANVEIKLEISSQKAVVEVDDSSNYRLLQTDNMKQSRSFSSEEMNDLPVQAGGQGRNFYAQARTAPGVAVTTQAHAPFAVSGNRPRSNNYLVDSVDNTDANTGLISGRGVTEQIISQEAVQSFEIITHNAKAEYGRNSGGIVNLVTKSGTNEVRGSAFWYHNNSALSARNFFQGEKPVNLSNLAGFTIGTPIVKNKLWAFGQFETFRVRGTSPSIYQGLTAADKAAANPNIAALAALFPTTATRGGFVSQGVPSATNQYTYLLRTDWQLNNSQRLMFRGSDTKSQRNQLGVGNLLTSAAPGNRRTAGVTLQHTWSLSPNIINELRLGYNRQVEQDNFEGTTPKLLGNSAINGELGTLRVTGLPTLGIPAFLFGNNFQNNTNLSNDLTYLRSNHTFKFGGNYRSIKVNGGNVDNSFRGTLTFNSVAQFLAGTPATYTRNVGNPQLGLRRKEMSLYAQDDWKLRSNFTLNLGLRYEVFTAPREVDNKLEAKNLLENDKNNFAPRFGFAWEALPKTVIRGGYGIYYNVVETTFLGLTRFNPPFIRSFTAVNPTFPNLLATAATGLPSGLVVPNKDTATPYSQHLSLSVERELFNPQTSLTVSYVGNLGRKLSRAIRPNGGEQLAQNLRPDTSLGVVNLLETSGNSNYNSLQVSYNQRFTNSFQVRAAYTYSKFIDEVSDLIIANTNLARDATPLDEARRFLDRGVSNFDIPQTLTFTYSYRLPIFRQNNIAGKLLGGWTVSGITTLRSGQPFTIYTGTNTPLGTNNQRPNVINGSLIFTPNQATAVTYATGFNAASLRPATNTFGTLGRNTERTDKVTDWNLSLQKDFRIDEKRKIQLRGEMFNVFNQTNFQAIDNVMTSATFGRYTSAFDPRRMQIALRFEF